jgi:DNA repair protein RadC
LSESAQAQPAHGRAAAELPRALRPRERLAVSGPDALSRAELIELLLGAGARLSDPRRVAERLLRRFGLARMPGLSLAEWCTEPGLGPAAAARLAAAFELGRRVTGSSEADRRPRLDRPANAFRHVRQLASAKKEHLVGLYLDAQNGLVHQETISIGSLNTTRTHPREILYPAVTHLALGFILAHNHPSGCLDPSPEDLEFTRAVRAAGELMGIELYDHLIVAAGSYVSLRERGLL